MAARQTGSSHAKLDLPCQDRFACSTEIDGWLIAAVADGAGSASHSEIGAQTAVDTAITAVREALLDQVFDLQTGMEPLLRSAAEQARNAILATAEEAELTPRDFACTLLVAALGPDGGGASQVGDGVIAVKDEEGVEDGGGWSWVFWPQRGEYANVTRFLTEPDALDVLEVCALPGSVREVALMTDGLEPLALQYSTRTAHSPFFEGMAAKLRDVDTSGLATELSGQLQQFLGSPKLAERVDDDLTLVLAART